jgi:hypothetical protein
VKYKSTNSAVGSWIEPQMMTVAENGLSHKAKLLMNNLTELPVFAPKHISSLRLTTFQ